MPLQMLGEKEQRDLIAQETRMTPLLATVQLYTSAEVPPVPFLVKDKYMTLADLVEVASGHAKIIRALHGDLCNTIYTVYMGGGAVEFDMKYDMESASGLQLMALDGYTTKVVIILVRVESEPAFAPPSPGKKRGRQEEEEWKTA